MGAHSVDAFKRSLEERFSQFLTDLDAVVAAFAAHGHGQHRMGPLQKMVEAARDINDYLAERDRPGWLTQIYNDGQAYLQNQDSKQAHQFLNALLKNYRSVRHIRFNDENAPLLNFDDLFVKYRDEGRLRELFDELIRIVNEIIASDEIDSVTALDTLQQIIGLLKSNRDGSYLAIKSTLKTTRFLKHLIDVYLEKIPVIKDLREAYERTTAEAEVALANVEAAIRDETLHVMNERIRHLERLPNFATESVEFKEHLALAGPLGLSHSQPASAE